MPNPRKTAFEILQKIEQENAYSNIALNNAVKENGLGHLDASFVSAIVYGVLERQITLDYIIRQYSKVPMRKIEKDTKIILRMGLLQLLFMDKVPQSAAVNESVNLAKALNHQKSAGFINALLRNVTRAEVKYTLPDKNDKVRYYAIKYSCPQEIVKLWLDAYNEENTVKLIESLNGRAQICARVNTLKNSKEELVKILNSQNVKTSDVPFLEDAVYLENTGSLEGLDAYKQGRLHIQDASSQLCVKFLKPEMHNIVLDVCAAPGGKSFTAAQYMNLKGKIFCCDMYEHKLKLIRAGAFRLGITNIVTMLRNAADDDCPLLNADRILCDVPCSGLGVMSRKPEIRYKDNIISDELPQTQYRILEQSAKYLANGGRLVYSTCTLNPKENNENAARFLKEHPDFYGIKLDIPTSIKRAVPEKEYEITLMPHKADTDGFYIAVFGKKVQS